MATIAPVNNAPFAVQNPPFPNIINQFARKVEQHVLTVAVSGGVPTVNTSLSSAGMTVTDTAVGRIGFTFPGGGTGAIGWITASPVNVPTPVAVMLSTNSGTMNFATGVGEVQTWDQGGLALDITGSFTLLINVIKAAV